MAGTGDEPQSHVLPWHGDPPSDLARMFFAKMAQSRPVMPVRKLARHFKRLVSEANPAVDELESMGLAVRWKVPKSDPTPAYHDFGPCVSLSPYAAEMIGIRLNTKATRWRPIAGWRERSAKIVVRTMGKRDDGTEITVITESAMALDPPGRLTDVADYRENAEPLAEILAEEWRDGLVRPNYLHGMGIAWDTLIQDPGPDAPRIERPDRTGKPCPGCGDKEMADDPDGLMREDCILCGNYCRAGKLAIARKVMRGIEQDERERKGKRA